MKPYFSESVANAKSNWARIALFFWILWATNSLWKMEKDIESASSQASFAVAKMATHATSDELEELKSSVEDIESTVEDIRR